MKSPLFLGLALGEARRLALAKQRQRAADEVKRLLRLLGILVGAARLALQAVEAPLQALKIGEHQLRLHRFDIGQRIDAALDVRDVGILEAAHHMRDGVDLADIGEKLVAEPLPFRGAAHQTGNVDEAQPRRHDRVRLRQRRKRFEAPIRHRDLSDIRLDGAERIVRRLRGGGLGERVEEGRLADIRQADDAAFEAHRPVSVSGGGLANVSDVVRTNR